MTDVSKDGGPAFGQVVELRCVRVEMTGSTEWEPEAMTAGGLTVRDYFAAKALQGLLAHPIGRKPRSGQSSMAAHAEAAYEYADAMLAAREVPS